MFGIYVVIKLKGNDENLSKLSVTMNIFEVADKRSCKY